MHMDVKAAFDHSNDIKLYISQKKISSLTRKMENEINLVIGDIDENIHQENDLSDYLEKLLNDKKLQKAYKKQSANELWNRKIFTPCIERIQKITKESFQNKKCLYGIAHKNYLDSIDIKGSEFLDDYTTSIYFPFALDHINCCGTLINKEQFVSVGKSQKKIVVDKIQLIAGNDENVESCKKKYRTHIPYRPTISNLKNNKDVSFMFKLDYHTQQPMKGSIMKAQIIHNNRKNVSDPREWVNLHYRMIESEARIRSQKRCNKSRHTNAFCNHDNVCEHNSS